MSSHQVSPCIPNDPSGFQKATTPELQITSNDKEANIQAKMAECKWCKAAREEAAWLEAERLKREEQVEAKKWEQEWLEAERKEQEWLEAECQEWEAQVQQKTGEPKGKEWEKAHNKGVEPKAEEARAKAGKKRAPEDVTSPRAMQKKKVT
ncbi:hypothetical protein BKA82DRAFT_4362128 [Pisolithus tinctorius]|nr:hypothetical protein BKA82DRAFT_4362128 [Pisolithus tinctorius]